MSGTSLAEQSLKEIYEKSLEMKSLLSAYRERLYLPKRVESIEAGGSFGRKDEDRDGAKLYSNLEELIDLIYFNYERVGKPVINASTISRSLSIKDSASSAKERRNSPISETSESSSSPTSMITSFLKKSSGSKASSLVTSSGLASPTYSSFSNSGKKVVVSVKNSGSNSSFALNNSSVPNNSNSEMFNKSKSHGSITSDYSSDDIKGSSSETSDRQKSLDPHFSLQKSLSIEKIHLTSKGGGSAKSNDNLVTKSSNGTPPVGPSLQATSNSGHLVQSHNSIVSKLRNKLVSWGISDSYSSPSTSPKNAQTTALNASADGLSDGIRESDSVKSKPIFSVDTNGSSTGHENRPSANHDLKSPTKLGNPDGKMFRRTVSDIRFKELEGSSNQNSPDSVNTLKNVKFSSIRPSNPQKLTREESAAIIIQRVYRLHTMHNHFQEIKRNINRLSLEQCATNSEGEPLNASESEHVLKASLIKQRLRAHSTLYSRNSQGGSKGNSEPNSIFDPTSNQKEMEKNEDQIQAKSDQKIPDSDQKSPSHSVRSLKKSFSDVSVIMSNSMNDSSMVREKDPEQTKIFIQNFNSGSPSKAVMQAIESKLFNGDCDSIAMALYNEKELSKTAIGNYLGEGEPLSIKVLEAFVRLMNFEGLTIDRALRLPGEAQKIDRVMSNFAIQYCLNNPSAFEYSDTAYVLAFSLIMLNTDSHNPNVKTKMSLKDFIRNNRGINNGKDLPEEYLTSLYNSIVNNEIKMHDEAEERRKFENILTKLTGKVESLEAPGRSVKYTFNVYHVFDVERLDPHKHERIAYFLNDMIILVKPIKKKLQFKVYKKLGSVLNLLLYHHFVGYPNLLSLWNNKDESLSLAFSTRESLDLFLEAFEAVSIELQEKEKTKLETLNKVAEVKAALERAYKVEISNTTTPVIETPFETTEGGDPYSSTRISTVNNNRYSKYGSLREARAILQQNKRVPLSERFKTPPSDSLTPPSRPMMISKSNENISSSNREEILEKGKSTIDFGKIPVEEQDNQVEPVNVRARSNTIHGYMISDVVSRLFELKPELFNSSSSHQTEKAEESNSAVTNNNNNESVILKPEENTDSAPPNPGKKGKSVKIVLDGPENTSGTKINNSIESNSTSERVLDSSNNNFRNVFRRQSSKKRFGAK